MAEHFQVTPAGWRLTFEDGAPDEATGKSKRRSYLVDGEKYPSVTTALGVLDKPGLVYAAEKLTVAGCVELALNGDLPLQVDGALARLKTYELRFWQRWQKKAARGTVTHEDLVRLTTGQQVLDVDQFPPDQRGFIQGAAAWFADYRPNVVASELMVASKVHGFAGRLDLVVDGMVGFEGRVLVDLKTTASLPRFKGGAVKPPYPEMLMQVAAYALALEESGYPPVDVETIVRIDESGTYDVTTSWCDERPFLAVLATYKALRGIDAARPKPVAA